MDWPTERLSKRLTFSPERTEEIFAILADIDSVKNAFKLTGKLPPQTISRLTQSVIVTSTGASNRIEGNRLSDEEVEALYKNLRIRSSSIVGLLILTLSLAFFYLYLKEVYPLREAALMSGQEQVNSDASVKSTKQ